MAKEISATARALRLPELLSRIFDWIRLDKGNHWRQLNNIDGQSRWGCQDVLAHCTLVNRLWYKEAVRHLYAEDPWSGMLPFCIVSSLSERVDTSRRAFFANLIKIARIDTVNDEDAQEYDDHVKGLSFPRLHTVKLLLGYGQRHIPRVQAPAVRRLVITPALYDVYPICHVLNQDGMDSVLDQIVTLFPYLEKVKFGDEAVVHPGALARFSSRLPHLTSFDHSLVVERDESV